MKLSFYILLSFFPIFLFSQENLTALDMFTKLPTDAFSTCDDISESDKEALIYNGKTEIWEVKTETKREFKFSGGDQSVTILKLGSGAYQIAAVNSNCAQSSTTEIWVYDSETGHLTKKDLLPKLNVTDFYYEEDAKKISPDYKGTISYFIDDGKIKASLYTWMQAELENIEIKYDIYAGWFKGKFVINKVEIK